MLEKNSLTVLFFHQTPFFNHLGSDRYKDKLRGTDLDLVSMAKVVFTVTLCEFSQMNYEPKHEKNHPAN